MNMLNNFAPQMPPPLVPPVPQKRVWGAWPTIGFSIVILVAFFIAQGIVIVIPVLGSIITNIGAGVSAPDELTNIILDTLNARLGLYQSIATIVSGIVGTGLILLFIRTHKGANIPEYLGLKRISFKTVLTAIGIIVLTIVVADVVQLLLGANQNENIMTQIYDTSVWPPLFWIAVIIFAPLFEEALFRGFLFEGLRQSWLGVYGAVMLTAFGWALLHGFQYSVSGIAYIFYLGIIMGIVRWKTGTIWSTFIMHAVVNLAATIALATNSNF